MNFSVSRRAAIAACVLLPLSSLGIGQTEPPIRLISPYGPGGAGDAVARGLAERLSPLLHANIVVDNKPGAGGSLGLSQAIKAAPDGKTLALVASSPITILPHLIKLPYDPSRDVAAIAPVMISPIVVVATSSFKGNSINDLLEQARQKPNTISVGTPGQGTAGHLLLASLSRSAKVDLVHVPYKAAGQRTTDAIAGVFDILVDNPNSAMMQQIKAGKLRLLAVSAPAKLADYPNVPTLSESGFPEAQFFTTWGVVGPSGLTREQRSKVSEAVKSAVKSPEFRTILATSYGQVADGTSEQFSTALKKESDDAARLIKAANIRLD